MKRKPISEQVLVVTGASSGIGLVTARMAAERGARVVLAARNPRSLRDAVESIAACGGRAIAAAVDVADVVQVEVLARAAIEEYGGFDTWINCAGLSMYGRLWETPLDDARRQTDVVYWGQVYGSLAAFRHFRDRPDGGGIINVTSALADRAIPLQGWYCAAKHATHAFTDALRMEIEEAGWPIAVSEVKPGSIDTPFFQKARSPLDREPQPVPPVYAPEIVAEAILACCARPRREVLVGGQAKLLSTAGKMVPRLLDRYLEARAVRSQISSIPVAADRRDNLWEALTDDGGERGRTWLGRTKESSLYTWLELHGRPFVLAALAGIAIPAFVSIVRRGAAPASVPESPRSAPELVSRECGELELPIYPT